MLGGKYLLVDYTHMYSPGHGQNKQINKEKP